LLLASPPKPQQLPKQESGKAGAKETAPRQEEQSTAAEAEKEGAGEAGIAGAREDGAAHPVQGSRRGSSGAASFSKALASEDSNDYDYDYSALLPQRAMAPRDNSDVLPVSNDEYNDLG
jgi:hypothetical protein